MKRQLILAFMAMLVAMPAMATQSRVDALTGLGGYIEDDTDVFIFPHVLNKWTNRVIAELNGFGSSPSTLTDRYAGVHVHMKKLGIHTGLYVNQPAPPMIRTGFSNIEPMKRATLMINKNAWGLQASFGGDVWKNDELPDPLPPGGVLEEESGTYIGFGGSASVKLGKAMSDIGVTVDLASASTTVAEPSARGGVSGAADESGLRINAAIRNHYDRGSNGKYVAMGVVSFGNSTIESADSDDATEDKLTEMFIALGLGWMYPASNNVTVMLAVEPLRFATSNNEFVTDSDGDSTFEDKETQLGFPAFFAGVEAVIAKWLTGRAGVGQVYKRITEETETVSDGGDPSTTKETTTESRFGVTMGVAVKLGKTFWIDGVLNDQWLFTGPHFIGGNTGSQAGSTMMSRLSIGAHWN